MSVSVSERVCECVHCASQKVRERERVCVCVCVCECVCLRLCMRV